MKNKNKNKVLIYIIIVLIIIALVIAGILGYKKIVYNAKNTNINKDIEEDSYNSLYNEQENISNQEKYDGTINKEIELNGEKISVELNYQNIELIGNDGNSKLYNQKYTVLINNKSIDGIEEGAKWFNEENKLIDEIYTLEKIKDNSSNKEYLVLKIYTDLIAGGPEIKVYIIENTSGKIIAKLIDNSNYSGRFLKEKMNKDEDGNYIENEEAKLKMEILEDSLVTYEYDEDTLALEKRKYIINNGKIEYKVEKTYSKDEIYTVGK